MSLRRNLNTPSPSLRSRPSGPSFQDVMMTDAISSTELGLATPPPSAPSPPADGSTVLGKRRHEEESSEHDSQPAVGPSSNIPGPSRRDVSPPMGFPTSVVPVTPPPRKRPNLSLGPLWVDDSPIPSTSFNAPVPVSPVVTEPAFDLPPITEEESEPEPELEPEPKPIEALQEQGIKVRDFAYEPFPNPSKAPEFFDPLSTLVAADWQMRNKIKNSGMLPPKFIWRLIKIGWLTVEDVKLHFHVNDYIELVRYNSRPDEQRYPFVLPRNVRKPTPAQRVRMRRKAGLATHEDDLPDSKFFGCEHENGNDICISDHHHHDDYRGRPSTPRDPAVAALEAASGSGPGSGTATRETEAKRKKGKGAGKSRSRAKKPLRREFSRPEV